MSLGFRRLKTKISLNFTYRCSSHGAPNILRLGYNSESVPYQEIIDPFSEIHSKHTRTLCGQTVEFLNVKTNDTTGLCRVKQKNSMRSL